MKTLNEETKGFENEVEENESLEGNGCFVIDNDTKADWAICKIKEEQDEAQRLIKLAEDKINELKEKIEQINQNFENKTSYLKSQLTNYISTVKTKSTKTQETYKLLSGTLVRKFSKTKMVPDREQLAAWAEENGYQNYIKVKKDIAWSDFSKTLTIVDNNAVDENGQIIDAIQVIQEDYKLDIKFE